MMLLYTLGNVKVNKSLHLCGSYRLDNWCVAQDNTLSKGSLLCNGHLPPEWCGYSGKVRNIDISSRVWEIAVDSNSQRKESSCGSVEVIASNDVVRLGVIAVAVLIADNLVKIAGLLVHHLSHCGLVQRPSSGQHQSTGIWWSFVSCWLDWLFGVLLNEEGI